MPIESLNVRSVFDCAVELTSDAQRRAYLDEVCAGAAEVRQRVEALLQAHASAGSFLQHPAVTADSALTIDQSRLEKPGTMVGPYKLLQQIGEGGMGTVWMAEQSHPVQRKVALEDCQARNGHATGPGPVRSGAAGAGSDGPCQHRQGPGRRHDRLGRSYFVMELVKGGPITTYCDEHRLKPNDRLELFLSVCQAIQHAHQKGIIHRDIKPTNVLVAPYDSSPVVKVIDFGIVKATGQRLTERTLFTEFGAVVGTLEYMSPEQAELNNQDIDTRSDIYSLGVLLVRIVDRHHATDSRASEASGVHGNAPR